MVSHHKRVCRTLLMEGEQMNAAVSACAPSSTSWDSIDWIAVQRHVRGLQARIVKAVQDGRHNKAKALQWLLTHSFSGKALAVKRVSENKGKNTAGVDKVTWNTPKAKTGAMMSLKRRGYTPLPLRRVLIPKKNGKMRPLGIPTMKCRAMQALHLLALEPIAETIADRNSYGFRPQRSTADAAAQCFGVLSRKVSAEWVLEGDIQGCFDNISHDWMIANLPMDKVILRKWLKAGYVYQSKLFPSLSGTPQGGIISPVLANMTLDGLETMLAKRFSNAKWTGKKLQLVRYADDFIITGYSKEWLENEVRPAVVEFLAQRGLVLSQEKTKITHIGNGFDFLGWNVRKYNGKLLIKPSKANISAHLDKLRALINANKATRQATLIGLLNPILRGWANYHSHVVAKKVFNQVDNAVWEMLWRWAVRRHPRKTLRWVKDRYFKVQGARRWVFSCDEQSADGRKRQYTLVSASDTPIVRHIKIKAAANPHDPAWDEYFESRWGKRMLVSAKGRAKLYRVWLKQGGRCCACLKPVTKDTPWHSRHIVKLSHGGTDAIANLEIYHLYCPRSVQFANVNDV